ncbi:MAG: DUF123 domain-containing protein [Terriglobia bacterium]
MGKAKSRGGGLRCAHLRATPLSCASNARIQIGRRGTMQLQRGYYVYLGSALGPGGLRARIAHHQKLSTRPHWHIDYLRAHSRLHSVWLRYDGSERGSADVRVLCVRLRLFLGKWGLRTRVRGL